MTEKWTPVGTEFKDMSTGNTMMLVSEGVWAGWLCCKHPDGNWVSTRLATEEDLRRLDLAKQGGKPNYSMGCHVSSFLEPDVWNYASSLIGKELCLWLIPSDRSQRILLLRADIIDCGRPEGKDIHIALHHPWNINYGREKFWIRTDLPGNLLFETVDPKEGSRIGLQQAPERTAREILGHEPSLGSKSDYRSVNPDKKPVFNATLCMMERDGFLRQIWFGDLELTACEANLLRLANELKTNVYVYRESVVNNETFNGRRFPYERWTAAVEYKQFKIQEN